MFSKTPIFLYVPQQNRLLMKKKREARGQSSSQFTQTPKRKRPTSTVIDENHVPPSEESVSKTNVPVTSVFRRVLADISNSPNETSGHSPFGQRAQSCSTAINKVNVTNSSSNYPTAKRARNISPITCKSCFNYYMLFRLHLNCNA